MSATPVRTTCPYCGVGCGVLATPTADGRVTIAGDPEHPANFGRLCSKGSALGETLALDDRLLAPTINGVDSTWDAALDLVATRFSETIAAHGPDAVAFYVSGQLLTEDYYVANKLMKGFIGSANIDTNSRLCMASSVAGHKRAFGADIVPGTYEDLEQADLVVLVGSNLAWCHPVLYQRLAAARATRGTKVVAIDPRRTATCDDADLHLALRPGSDVALFNGLLAHLADIGAVDLDYTAKYTSGLEAALAVAHDFNAADVATATGLTIANVTAFYRLFAKTPRVVTVYSQGVNQSTAGTDKVNAIINCHLATGRIGQPGMGPFSVTGQPNAMGGREVGGLATMLAAHLELDNAEHRQLLQTFWQSPRMAEAGGLKAVDLFKAVGDGRIKAIWILSTNPVDSMPDANAVRAALRACPFVVVSDVIATTDTTACAHVLLPATAWGEKDGTVTNSERRISRQRAFLDAPGLARPDWWQLAEVARRMGFQAAFDYQNPSQIFAEHAQLSAWGNTGTRAFDIGAASNMSAAGYADLEPFQWPQPTGVLQQTTRFFKDGGFFTADRRGRLVATPYRQPASKTDTEFPLAMNTGRIRDQWHTMTRSAKAARLLTHHAEPFIELHPADAAALEIAPGSLVRVNSAHGAVVLRAVVTDRIQPGAVFAPIHWTDQYASNARVDVLIGAHVDPVSGQPELKYTPVRLTPFAAQWHGFAVSITRPNVPQADYWARAGVKAGWRLDLAGGSGTSDPVAQFECLLPPAGDGPPTDLVSYADAATGRHHFAAFVDGRLVAALFMAHAPLAISRSYVIEQLGAVAADPTQRYRLLAGVPPDDVADPGPTICACFEIGRTQIIEAITAKACATVDAIGVQTRAGTNCGSCRPELGALLHATQRAPVN